MDDSCAVLDWAASGAMALTGPPGGPPVASPAPTLARLAWVTAELARVTGRTGTAVHAQAAELVAGRAALAGLTRGGRVSAGGASFLLRAADGWCAVTLSRPDDIAAVPAIAGLLGRDAASPRPAATRAQARAALTAAARGARAEDLAAAAQLAGVPAAALPAAAGPPAGPGADGARAGRAAGAAAWPPWRTERIAAPLAGARLAGAVVADLSAMWAGPLCARLLGLAGATVVKVESPARPDGARYGNREFFDWLHAGHRSLAADFGTRAGRAALAALLQAADIVIESSRPRALAAAGAAPGMIPHRPGQVWLSITGYGRSVPGRVAFGDDAAVAGGLVGWTAGARSGPVFCADAIADPLAGACGALAVALARSAGGGQLIDLPMRDVAAAFAAPGPDDCPPGHGPHPVLPGGAVACPRARREQAVLAPRRPSPPAGPAGPAPELGADTRAVLAWLAGRRAAC
jgi:crotonobetainyl-CoA:carnitine CoA-transferase CaiB-like acyl-CoA transferase